MSSPRITFQDKKTGSNHLAKDVNEVKTVVNTHASELDAMNVRVTDLENSPIADLTAENLTYDNTVTNLEAENVQEAVDELLGKIQDSQSEIDNLAINVPTHTHTASAITNFVSAVKSNETVTILESIGGGNFRFTNESGSVTTLNVSTLLNLAGIDSIEYDNTVSGLSAEDIKSAIDELATNPVINVTPTGTEKSRNISDKFAERISILDFNNVFSDYSSDSTAGIQAAENYCNSIASQNKRVELFFPAGTYKISAPILKKSYVNWAGPGILKRTKADEEFSSFNTSTETQFSLVSCNNITEFKIANMGFVTLPARVGTKLNRRDNNSNIGNLNSCIDIRGCSNYEISNNRFRKYSMGVIYQNCDFGIITKNIMTDGGLNTASDIVNGTYSIDYEFSGCGAICQGSTSSGPSFASRGMSIQGNIIDNSNGDVAIESLNQSWEPQPSIISDNLIFGSRSGIQSYRGSFNDTALETYPSDRYEMQSLIINNLIYGTYEHGIHIHGGTLVKCSNNLLIHVAKKGTDYSESSCGAIVTNVNPWASQSSEIFKGASEISEEAIIEISSNYIWNPGNDGDYLNPDWESGDPLAEKYFSGVGLNGAIQLRLPKVKCFNNFIGRDEKIFSTSFSDSVMDGTTGVWGSGQKGTGILVDNGENITEYDIHNNRVFNFRTGIIHSTTSNTSSNKSNKSFIKENTIELCRTGINLDSRIVEGVLISENYIKDFDIALTIKKAPFSIIKNNIFKLGNKSIEIGSGCLSSDIPLLKIFNMNPGTEKNTALSNYITNKRRGGTLIIKDNIHDNVTTPHSAIETSSNDSTFNGRCLEFTGDRIDGIKMLENSFSSIPSGASTSSVKSYSPGDILTKSTISGIFENRCTSGGTYGSTINYTCDVTAGSNIVTNIINLDLHIQSIQGENYNSAIASGYLDGLGPQQWVSIGGVRHWIKDVIVDPVNPVNNRLILRDNSTITATNATLLNISPSFITSGAEYSATNISVDSASFDSTASNTQTALANLNTGKVRRISTISSLRSLSTANLSTGNTVYVESYDSSSLEGGGFFRWDSTLTTADDNGIIISPSTNPASGRWRRLIQFSQDYVSIRCFGQGSSGLQRALVSPNVNNIFIPPISGGGDYNPSALGFDVLQITGNKKLRGEGNTSSISMGKDGVKFEVAGSSVSFENLRFVSSFNSPSVNSDGVITINGANSNISDVKIENCTFETLNQGNSCIRIIANNSFNVDNITIRNNRFNSCGGIPIEIINTGTIERLQNFIIENNKFNENIHRKGVSRKSHIEISGLSKNSKIRGNNFDGNSSSIGIGIFIDGNSEGIVISDNDFEGSFKNLIETTGTTVLRNAIIHGNSSTEATVGSIELSASSDNIISSNNFSITGKLILDGISSNNFINNNIIESTSSNLIELIDSNDNVISNNTLDNSSATVKNEVILLNNSSNNNIFNNSLMNTNSKYFSQVNGSNNPNIFQNILDSEKEKISMADISGYVLNNISALRNYEPINTSQIIVVLGHTSLNDGGGGDFVWDPSDSVSVDDNGLTIVTTSGKRWKRVLTNGDINIRFWGAIGDGAANDTIAWQRACSSINDSTLHIPKGVYIVNDTATIINKGRISGQKGAEIKLANNSLVNTDTSYGNFFPMLRIQGVDGFIIDSLGVNGNRANQIYPVTRSSFGRGNSSRRHNASIEICSDGTNQSRNVTIQNCEIYDSYLSGVMAIQTVGIRFLNNYTHDNTWNGFGGGENTDVLCESNHSFRDGVSSQYPDSQNGGDRGAFQFREFPGNLTTSSEGIPIIPNLPSLGTNTNIRLQNNYIEEPCVIGMFARACYGIVMQGNTVKNAGYQRVNDIYEPASLWFEWSTGIMKDNIIIQTTDNDANGWHRPIALLATGLRGDSTNDAKMDGVYSVEITGNIAFCGQTYDNVINHTSNARKKNNFHAGIFTDKEAIIHNNIIEGTYEHLIMLITDANFSAEYQKNITITNNRFFNSLASNCIRFFNNGSPTGTIDNITIKGNEIYDLRSEETTGEPRIVIYFPTEYATAGITKLDISDNYVDCSNSADTTKNYQCIRIRCNETSNIHLHNNKIKGSSIFLGVTRWNNLFIEKNYLEDCESAFAFNVLANNGLLKITDNNFLGMKTRIGEFVPNSFSLDTLIMKDNIFSGNFTANSSFVTGTSLVCPRKLVYENNIDNTLVIIDPVSLADASGSIFTFTNRIYARLGDFIQSSFSLDTQGLWFNSYVSANNSIGVRIRNETGFTVDLASGNCKIAKREIKQKDITGMKPYDPPSLAINSQVTTTVNVIGARIGDYTLASFSKNLVNSGLVSLFSYVSAADTVTVIFNNASGAVADLESGLLRVCVIPKDYAYGLTGNTSFDPSSLLDGSGETTIVTVSGARLGDISMASFSNDLQGVIMYSWVSGNDTVSVRFQNETGATVDLASGIINVVIES